MMSLLVFRERVKNIYQKYNLYITPAVKFVFALISLIAINNELGYDARLKSIPIVLALSLLSAFTPSAILVLVSGLVATLHFYFVSPIMSIIVLILFIIIYLLFARFTPRYGYVILAIPILFFLKIPYIIPILLGIIATPIAIIPITCGVFIYYVLDVIKAAITMQQNTSLEDILQLYINVIDSLTGNKQMIMTIVIFALILLVVFYVRKMKFDYAFEISIAAGAFASILGFLVSDLILDKSDQIFSMLLGTVLSAAIVFVINFFKLTLDYSRTEIVQFEDDAYYYYVKAVPKITVTTPQMKVKHINVKNAAQGAARSGFRRQDSVPDDDYDYEDEDDSYLNLNNSDNEDQD